MSQVVVTFAALEQAAADIRALNARLADMQSSLKRDIAPVTESWSGDAREGYLVQQASWDRNARGLQEALNGIADGLTRAADAYRRTEASNARMWG
ncbi:WXG100 family type VII secretion target [Embleya sp. NPDC001921]